MNTVVIRQLPAGGYEVLLNGKDIAGDLSHVSIEAGRDGARIALEYLCFETMSTELEESEIHHRCPYEKEV